MYVYSNQFTTNMIPTTAFVYSCVLIYTIKITWYITFKIYTIKISWTNTVESCTVTVNLTIYFCVIIRSVFADIICSSIKIAFVFIETSKIRTIKSTILIIQTIFWKEKIEFINNLKLKPLSKKTISYSCYSRNDVYLVI